MNTAEKKQDWQKITGQMPVLWFQFCICEDFLPFLLLILNQLNDI